MSLEDILGRQKSLKERVLKTNKKQAKLIKETDRVIDLSRNTPKILDNLDEEFCRRTKLDMADIGFLFFAVSLQVLRQYLCTFFPDVRLGDQDAANSTWFHSEEHSNRMHAPYNPSLEQIWANPVPFDVIRGSNGALSGGGSFGHRGATLGHDPLLGLIFGTANIATSTVTTKDFSSYHVYTGVGGDVFGDKADTAIILSHMLDKIFNQGLEGKKIIASAFFKEIIHLQSDILSKKSLPVPLVTVFSPTIASDMAEYGIDMANIEIVGKQSLLAQLINWIISQLHSLIYFLGKDKTERGRRLHEAKTKKIISYSDIIASVSNVAVCVATENPKLLDLGGIAVSILNFFRNAKEIRKIKEEFISGTYRDMLWGDSDFFESD